ncbi:hypothetical protein CCHL11_01054 [Colletotrichum chlorophyti]|uniref:Uncharacterized protein n=1 Tax=Colletotrichum chlorophyti TaxID=708187 RepID=A0A1Q8S7D7_9PEZI|nr:hypothetical protein CCHL11_01054 [Colletotrichum chlorophyti]
MSSPASGDRGLPHYVVDKTPFAPAYHSRFTEEIIDSGGYSRGKGPVDIHLLRHVNCGYLSTHGVAPTLLALKQHAHSLATLIAQLTPSSQYAEVDNSNDPDGRIKKSFRDNEAFDWLNNLSKPYENEDEWHQRPLTDLMNKIKGQSDSHVTVHHCPLETFENDKASRAVPRPYASHSALAMHANDCLEMLDHEYGATGGLMSLLPTDAGHDSAEMKVLRNSLLGQWLLFNQHLVARTHDLELSYADSLDVIAGEAAVPMQMLSKMGPDASSGREIAYPQDKWILANAGDDVFDYLSRVFDRQEELLEYKRDVYVRNGTYGERMWNERRGGDLYARGLVYYDVTTRYFRLQGKGRNTIFVLPAYGEHPALQQTRRLQVTPKVVSVVTPAWPARVSDWESKYKEKLDAATRAEIEVQKLTTSSHALKEHNETLATELHKTRFMLGKFEEYYDTSDDSDSKKNLEQRAADLEVQLQNKTDHVESLEKKVAELELRLKPNARASSQSRPVKVSGRRQSQVNAFGSPEQR